MIENKINIAKWSGLLSIIVRIFLVPLFSHDLLEFSSTFA